MKVYKLAVLISFLVYLILPEILFSQELKVGTLAPAASKWGQVLTELSERIREKSQGKIKLVIYPGGVMGDEEEMIRKIRIGQLHIGAFTINGIKKIAPQLGVIDLPFLFRNYNEVDFILKKFEKEFSDYFIKGGFKIMAFSEHGFVYFFSKSNVDSFKDLGKTRFWGWKGDKTITNLIKSLGTTPIYVPVPDLLSALETGMVETFQTTPISCLSLQWCKLVKTMIDFPYRYEPGVLAISSEIWEKLPQDAKSIIESAIQEEQKNHGGNINKIIRDEQEKTKQKLKEIGIKFVNPPDKDTFENEIKQKIWFSEDSEYPHDLLKRIIQELDNFRKKTG